MYLSQNYGFVLTNLLKIGRFYVLARKPCSLGSESTDMSRTQSDAEGVAVPVTDFR